MSASLLAFGEDLRPGHVLDEQPERVVQHDLRALGELGVDPRGDIGLPVLGRLRLPAVHPDLIPADLPRVFAHRQDAGDLGAHREVAERGMLAVVAIEVGGGVAARHGVDAVDQRFLGCRVGDDGPGVPDPVGDLCLDDALVHGTARDGLRHGDRVAHLVDRHHVRLDLGLGTDEDDARDGDGGDGQGANRRVAPALGAGECIAIALIPLATRVQIGVGFRHHSSCSWVMGQGPYLDCAGGCRRCCLMRSVVLAGESQESRAFERPVAAMATLRHSNNDPVRQGKAWPTSAQRGP